MKKRETDKIKSFQLPDAEDKSSVTSDFTVPAGYFENSEEQIMARINAISELGNLNATNPFATPANYFEELPHVLRQKIEDNTPDSKRIEWMILFRRPQLGLAFASLLVLLWFGIQTRRVKTIETPESEINIDELVNSGYVNDIEEYMIIEMLLAHEEPSSQASDPYIEYLLENDIEMSQLENKL